LGGRAGIDDDDLGEPTELDFERHQRRSNNRIMQDPAGRWIDVGDRYPFHLARQQAPNGHCAGDGVRVREWQDRSVLENWWKSFFQP
jgi:hypothetical protein